MTTGTERRGVDPVFVPSAAVMGNEKNGTENLFTPSQRRRRLSNITNLSLSANWGSNTREDMVPKSGSKSSDFQLQQENAALKKLLSEREMALEAQVGDMERMQTEFLMQLRRQSKVNEEIIGYNSRLSKEVFHLRDQLRLLQHENGQMSVAYRVQLSELQGKLTETQDQLKKLLQDMESKMPTSSREDPPCVTRKPRTKSHRRHSTAGNIMLDSDWNHSTKVEFERPEEGLNRPDLRRRSGRLVLSKEDASKPKPVAPLVPPAPTRHINRYSDLIGLEPMLEVSEEETSPCSSASRSCSPPGEDLSKSGLSSESNTTRTDDAFATSRSTGSSAPSTSLKGSQTLKTNKVNLVPTEPKKAASTNSSSAPHFSRRVYNSLVSGTGRPVRKAVENIASYREPPLNTKMRRPA